MSAETQVQGGYGFSEGTQPNRSNVKFGLNTGDIYLKKFAWTANGGKDGAEMEALDIIFDINGSEVSYRQFPITKAFYKEDPDDKNSKQLETTDPNHDAFKQAQTELSAILVHIIGCFVPKEDIKAALQQRITSFKDYCRVLQGLLPEGFETQPLDLFMNWQWNIKGDNEKTYLELPKNMKHGRWASAAITPAGGSWEQQTRPNADDNAVALRYVDGEGNVHPFTRNGWFMNSNFASQQKEEQEETAMNETAGSGGW